MMIFSRKVVTHLSCGFLLWIGLLPVSVVWPSNQLNVAPSVILVTDSIGTSKPGKTIKGEVVSVEGEDYSIRQENGQVVRIHVDQTTNTKAPFMKAKPGDNVVAKVDDQGHAISFLTDQPISR